MVTELRSCATALQLLVRSGLHRFSVRLLPGRHSLHGTACKRRPRAVPLGAVARTRSASHTHAFTSMLPRWACGHIVWRQAMWSDRPATMERP